MIIACNIIVQKKATKLTEEAKNYHIAIYKYYYVIAGIILLLALVTEVKRRVMNTFLSTN